MYLSSQHTLLKVIFGNVLRSPEASHYTAAPRTIYKDVVILGGGASGAHAAVRLREDYNKNIIIIEKQDNLGGHVETYIDPVTGNPYDYGVNSYAEYGNESAFFARFNLTLVNPTSIKLNTTNIDFVSGKPLVRYQAPASADVTAALERYLNLTEKYENMLLPSYANFPTEVPDELLTKFSDIVEKYELHACLPLLYQVTGFGLGNMGDELLLFMMQEFSAPMTRALLGLKGSRVPNTHQNQDLYDRIGVLLGNDVLYSTIIIDSNRTSDGVQLLVSNAAGENTTIIAKKLLVSFALSAENTAPLNLSPAEQEVFSTLGLAHEYCGIVTSPSLPINGSLVNIPSAAVPADYLAFPTPPFVVRYQFLGDTNFRILLTGTENYTLPLARQLTNNTFGALQSAGDIPQGANLTIRALEEHTTTKQAIPRRRTFYTGRSWTGQFTTILWEFNDQWMLPRLLASF
ncbi:amino oxidase [Hyaloscypha variabilis F]|uniref:Amino oxidase n=1 Tax=Hyaloscypha variabilis (strain UAMH 11265 / GT02V1 / F) TaxID=1149755 RepID=A0A2J6RR74_HYAVF|nr:amino oxidase [Hyaloscypha variabilis F]